VAKNSISEIGIRLIISIFSFIVALIPFWTFWGVRTLAQPEGFWQNIFVFGLGFYFGGAMQIILLIFWIVFILTVWADD